MNRLYIASIEISCVPKNKHNRLFTVNIKKDLQPIVLDDLDMTIPMDRLDKEIMNHLRYKQNSEWKYKIKDTAKYNITYKLSNIKFSSNIYGGSKTT